MSHCRHEAYLLRQLLVGDMQFPVTYASWLQLTYRGDIGVPAKSIDVYCHEFADFCRVQVKAPSMDLLKTFAIVKSRKDRLEHGGPEIYQGLLHRFHNEKGL